MNAPHRLHARAGWRAFAWDDARSGPKLAAVIPRQGRLIGRMESLGFGLRSKAVLTMLT